MLIYALPLSILLSISTFANDDFRENDRVLCNGLYGTVVEMPKNGGRAKIKLENNKIDSYYFTFCENVTPLDKGAMLNGYKVGDRVNCGAQNGMIVQILANGKVDVVQDNNKKVTQTLKNCTSMNPLGEGASLYGHKVKDRISCDGDKGVVIEILPNNKAKVAFDKGGIKDSWIRNCKNINSLEKGAILDGHKVDDKILCGKDEGRVMEILANGSAKVFFDKSGIRTTWIKNCQNINPLGPDGVLHGHTVYDRISCDGNDGLITEILSNGTARVLFDKFGAHIRDIKKCVSKNFNNGRVVAIGDNEDKDCTHCGPEEAQGAPVSQGLAIPEYINVKKILIEEAKEKRNSKKLDPKINIID